jgi:hypothetical protein
VDSVAQISQSADFSALDCEYCIAESGPAANMRRKNGATLSFDRARRSAVSKTFFNLQI